MEAVEEGTFHDELGDNKWLMAHYRGCLSVCLDSKKNRASPSKKSAIAQQDKFLSQLVLVTEGLHLPLIA